MAKQKYEVIRPWFGVKAGDVVEIDPDKMNRAFAANVRALRGQVAAAVNGKTDEPVDVDLTDKRAVIAALKARGIAHDGRSTVEELAELLTQPGK